MDYYPVRKKNEMLSFATKLIKLESIASSYYVNQNYPDSQNKYYLLSVIYGNLKWVFLKVKWIVGLVRAPEGCLEKKPGWIWQCILYV